MTAGRADPLLANRFRLLEQIAVDLGGRVVPLLADGTETVPMDAPSYVPLQADEVRAALVDLGLVPRLAYDGSGTPVGTVSSVDPAREAATKTGRDKADRPGHRKGRGRT